MARVITARRADYCRECRGSIAAGERINYGGRDAVTHEGCRPLENVRTRYGRRVYGAGIRQPAHGARTRRAADAATRGGEMYSPPTYPPGEMHATYDAPALACPMCGSADLAEPYDNGYIPDATSCHDCGARMTADAATPGTTEHEYIRANISAAA